jgi:uncharacterized membrane protein YcaP (DUF421 family)
MNELTEIIVRGVVAFLFLMLLAQIIGKQLIGQMSYHHFIATISLGSIAGNTVFNVRIKFLYFILAYVIFSVMTLAFTYVSMKTRIARKWITGEPKVVIENGAILEHNMKKVFYTLDALNQGLRKKDIFNISEVEYAVLEPDGSLSVLKKAAYRSVQKSDLSLHPTSEIPYPVELIREGKVLEHNLAAHRLSMDWLHKELADRNVLLTEVFYGVRGADGHLFLDKYKEDRSKP